MELSDLIDRIDIVDYISQYVELEEKGSEYWGTSPFTFPPEKTPSFSVRRENKSFYDFSSGIGGNAFTFAKRYFRCSSLEAIEKLKAFAGIDGEAIISGNKLAATTICRRYMSKKRTEKQSKGIILREDYMERYAKDYGKLQVWLDEGISRASLDKFQVYYDSFSQRIVYPIRNLSGQIVNIGGRTLDPEWKTKKIPKYCYFHPWGTVDTIYGVAENMTTVKKSGEIIIFEGCKSVLMANTWGIENTGAILTSHLSPFQMKSLAQLGCRVVFALDKDVDVTKDHNIQKLKQFVRVEYICDAHGLLDAKDSPVDKGMEVFKTLYTQRKRMN